MCILNEDNKKVMRDWKHASYTIQLKLHIITV